MVHKILNTFKVLLLLSVSLYSCTDNNYIDGGLAKGVHDCTMWEYFENQNVDWDSTMIMIEYAGMKSYFDGSGQYKEITFFGITDIAIARAMLRHNYLLDLKKQNGETIDENDYWHRVKDIPKETCVSILKKLIVPEQRIMLKNVPKGTRLKNTEGSDYIENGGKVFTSLAGELFIWMEQENYMGLQEMGEKMLFIARRLKIASNWRIASTDIQTTTGVVNAMGYEFDMENF